MGMSEAGDWTGDGGWQSDRVMIMGFHEGRVQKGYTAVNDNSFPRDLTTEILG